MVRTAARNRTHVQRALGALAEDLLENFGVEMTIEWSAALDDVKKVTRQVKGWRPQVGLFFNIL